MFLKKGSLHLTDEEITGNTMVIWCPLEQALKIISETEDILHVRYGLDGLSFLAATRNIMSPLK